MREDLVPLRGTYVLPIRRVAPDRGLGHYLRWLAGRLEVIVVDGSPPDVFSEHHRLWGQYTVHIAPALSTPNGKVGGVLTGLRLAHHERVIVADDDVRYDREGLQRLLALLDGADVVRPQNYFAPLPWHARWDTARSLINRATGGDWPGTLGLRRALLLDAGGYDGRALFENLELVGTVRAAGGREVVATDLFVRRLPPTTRQFLSQRVRQAYDEWAQPTRLLLSLAILPLVSILALRRQWTVLVSLAAASAILAEGGRRRAGGRAVFPASASLLAPLWVLERAVCIWIALADRLAGGTRYRGQRLPLAANSPRTLRRRIAARQRARDHASPQPLSPSLPTRISPHELAPVGAQPRSTSS